MINPSQDWPRRTIPLAGNEDLLKQNPTGDTSPQEERIPTSLISDFTISQISFTNLGAGVGTFDFKLGSNIRLRSIAALSNKITATLQPDKSIGLDLNTTNIAAEIPLNKLANVENVTPTGSQFLSYNSTSNKWEPKSLSVENALSYISDKIVLGGAMTQNTTVSGANNFYLWFLDMYSFRVKATDNAFTTVEMNLNPSNNGAFFITSSKDSKFMGIDGSQINNYLKVYRRESFNTYSLFIKSGQTLLSYEEGSTEKAAVGIKNTKLYVLDGTTNTPTSRWYLMRQSDGTTAFSPEKRAFPLQVFGATQDVVISSSSTYFVMPAQLQPMVLKGYTASVFTLGTGGTTDVVLKLNGTTVSSSNISFLGAKSQSAPFISENVFGGDIISVEVTGERSTTKDKGLSLSLYFECQ